jgi:hypothetical protein
MTGLRKGIQDRPLWLKTQAVSAGLLLAYRKR